MIDINKIILVGRLGSDPTQRETKNGVSVVQFSMATSRRLAKNGDEGEKNEQPAEETTWHKIIAWGRQGEACAQYLKKGNPVYVEGSVRNRNFKDKDGKPRNIVEVHADSVSFLGSAPRVVPTLQSAENEVYVH